MPPKSKKTAKPREQFLFINEDSSTLSRGSKNTEVESSKQSHVQWQSFARRKGLPRGGKISATASPSPSDSASTPVSTGGQSNTRLTSGTQTPSLPLRAPENLWLPAGAQKPLEAFKTRSLSYPPWSEPSSRDVAANTWLNEQRYDFTSFQREQLENSLTKTTSLDFNTPISSTTSAFPVDSATFRSVNYSGAPLVDPFTSTQVALELWAPPLIRHFTMEFVPELFHTDLKAVSLQNMRHANSLHEDMTACMSNPAEMYALLAASASHAMGRDERLRLPHLAEEDSNRVTLLFISKALEAIRYRLASGTPHKRIVIAVQRMVGAAMYFGNFSAAEAHYRAALSMMEQVGGLETFDDFQKERLIMEDLNYALGTNSRPKLQLTWDPGSLDEGTNVNLFTDVDHEKLSEHGSRLRTCFSEIKCHSLVVQAVQDLVETQYTADWLRSQPYIPAQYRWLVQRRLGVLHTLISIQPSMESEMEPLTSPTNVIRLAVICYVFLTENVSLWRTALVEQHIVLEMQGWEVHHSEGFFESFQEMLLWILTLFGTMLTPVPNQVRTQLTGETLEVFNNLVELGTKVCGSLRIERETQLRSLLSNFLLNDEITGERYLAFVDSLKIKRE